MALKTGFYTLSSVDYSGGPGHVVSRPLGVGEKPDGRFQVVVLPKGSAAPKWYIVNTGENSILRIARKAARPAGEDVGLDNEDPLFQWLVLRGAPSPPPIGNDSFGIIASGSPDIQQSWLIPSTDGQDAVEVPVLLGEVASSIHIVAA